MDSGIEAELPVLMNLKLPRRHAFIAMIIASALFMESLDSTVIATALPQMAISLGSTPIHLNLAVTSYLLSLAVFVPASGWVADRFGARVVFRAAIAGFTLASVLCGFSDSLPTLLAARVLQGIGGAMMVPVGRLILMRSVSKAELMQATAYLMVPSMMGMVLGPPLGGLITTYVSWRWIFFINVPVGIVGIGLVTWFIENIRDPVPRPFDFRGFLLTGVSLLALMAGFELVTRGYVLWFAVSLVLVGLAVGMASIWHARRHPTPLLDLDLFRLATFASSVAGGCMFRISAGALPFLLPLMLQVGFGMSALESGLLSFASAAGALVMKALARRIVGRVGFRTALTVNGVISAVSLTACATFTVHMSAIVIFATLLVGGFFRSLQYTALNTLAFADVPKAKMGNATSFYAIVQQLSSAIGVAAGAALLQAIHNWRSLGLLLQPGDFQIAFVLVGVSGLMGLAIFARMDADAGAEVSGRGQVRQAKGVEAEA